MTKEVIKLRDDLATYFISNEVLINNATDVLEWIGELDTNAIILHDYNFAGDFFDLSSKKLGDVLQKMTNYRIKMAIIGDFTKYPSQVLPQFIAESNRQRDYIFVSSLDMVKKVWG